MPEEGAYRTPGEQGEGGASADRRIAEEQAPEDPVGEEPGKAPGGKVSDQPSQPETPDARRSGLADVRQFPEALEKLPEQRGCGDFRVGDLLARGEPPERFHLVP